MIVPPILKIKTDVKSELLNSVSKNRKVFFIPINFQQELSMLTLSITNRNAYIAKTKSSTQTQRNYVDYYVQLMFYHYIQNNEKRINKKNWENIRILQCILFNNEKIEEQI